jgi:regulator of ribosome biosynthesis
MHITHKHFHLHREVHEGPLTLDLGNLLAWDASAVDAAALAAPSTDAACQRLAQSIFQSLAARLFALPSEAGAGGRVAQLPRPYTALPREKPIPKPRPLTKWEEFAQRKGIQKQKRSKLEWDETSQEWRRRYGFRRVKDEASVPIIEAKPGDVVREACCLGMHCWLVQGAITCDTHPTSGLLLACSLGRTPSPSSGRKRGSV